MIDTREDFGACIENIGGVEAVRREAVYRRCSKIPLQVSDPSSTAWSQVERERWWSSGFPPELRTPGQKSD
jgi:hypothetical protein